MLNYSATLNEITDLRRKVGSGRFVLFPCDLFLFVSVCCRLFPFVSVAAGFGFYLRFLFNQARSLCMRATPTSVFNHSRL